MNDLKPCPLCKERDRIIDELITKIKDLRTALADQDDLYKVAVSELWDVNLMLDEIAEVWIGHVPPGQAWAELRDIFAERKDGNDKYTTEINAKVLFPTGPKGEGRPAGVGDSGHFEPPELPAEDDDDDELPF